LTFFLSVCLAAGLLKKLWTDFDEIFGEARRGPKNDRFDFGGDPDPEISLKKIIAISIQSQGET